MEAVGSMYRASATNKNLEDKKLKLKNARFHRRVDVVVKKRRKAIFTFRVNIQQPNPNIYIFALM